MRIVTVDGPSTARETVAAAIARSLKLTGFRVAGIHSGPPHSQRFPCPGGKSVSRFGALLADCCGLPHEEHFENGSEQEFSHEFDWFVVVGGGARKGGADVMVEAAGAGYRVRSGDLDFSLPAAPAADVMGNLDEDVDALPPYSPGVPRIGIISWPHIGNLLDFLPIRGAEWIAYPLPGRLDVIFLPQSGDPAFDREWLSEQGLDEWLALQRGLACKLVSTGYRHPGVSLELGVGELKDVNVLSRTIGARVSPPLPSEVELDDLAAWWNANAPVLPQQLPVE